MLDCSFGAPTSCIPFFESVPRSKALTFFPTKLHAGIVKRATPAIERTKKFLKFDLNESRAIGINLQLGFF
jgi:hypothetical protein